MALCLYKRPFLLTEGDVDLSGGKGPGGLKSTCKWVSLSPHQGEINRQVDGRDEGSGH